MGINLVRNMTVAVLVVAVVCSLTLSVAAQQQGNCTSKTPDGRALGQCTPIRECPYFMRILAAQSVSQSDRNLLRENQCNHQQRDTSVHVCCPLDTTNNDRISGSAQSGKEGLGAFKHPLLPRNCGIVKWERSNNTETNIKEYPWLALIEYTKPNQEKLHACGGVLISERYVLTAAHCASGNAISKLDWEIRAVRLGEWDTMTNPDCQVSAASGQSECAPPFQDVAVDEIIVHRFYNKDGASQTNDIALIRLRDPAQLSDYVQPICLPNQQLRADELEELVTEVGGWQAKSSSKMKKNEVIIESLEDCQRKYAAHNIRLMSSQLCGAANADECRGNSGGPLMLFKNDAYLLGGLLSFGPVACPSPGWPDVYTRVASYIEWIHSNLKA